MSINLNNNEIAYTGYTSAGYITSVPTVVTNGLVLWYDAGNNASYINSTNYYDCGYGCQYYAYNPGCTNCNIQIKDMSGLGNDGTFYYSTTVTYENVGGVISFNGTTNNIRLSSTLSAFFNRVNGDAMSIGVWMYPGRNAGQYQDIVANRSDVSSYNWILYQHATDGSIQFHGANQNKSSYIPTLNTWIYVVATVSAGGVSLLYANGELQQTVNGYTYGSSAPSLLCIGAYGASTVNEPYLGKMSIIQIYNRDLNATEILQNFNSGRQRFGI